ncbi:tetratricopeptide repeat protein [Clostridium luticellarii]|jgi:tetratricopeptide (TPR) repeat protein|uniref:Tetratricopeptide repeat protein n=1 Tax=Clostridium luticellarii TaxID=1691940 RepID=A0A2T0BSG3_9CLOT|nr:tetratricopeptide repeat protein [Clostridium luticellarii]MCI1944729.1 tetratricopeptide repeat protein [Clostridium luticellarii]MCI1968226.1 tetratricopeptide repeat protein [Clostridium luticellarii]MCI1995229.1 tetratricopeptide repeat protein [Clostridium luticellarii]MCI2039774.1 tetratricopeptide repeat protein [Clostridium luticellarii]PRR86755.1 Tetratricopeptide repeat protein [Clostridium luticellarii]
MDKSQKIYNKALDKYNKGYIGKSMELCDESISISIKNGAAINLKGLLLYLKGDLKGARKIWEMNYEVNGDKVAQRYIQGSEEDEIRFNLYKRALVLIKELKINEALKLLERCAESDYNYIEINNYSALCYIKKGSYNRALEKINNVLKVDVDNLQAKKNVKLLRDMNVIKKEFNVKKTVCISAAVLCAVSLLFIGIYTGRLNFKNHFANKDNVAKVEKVKKTKENFKDNPNTNNIEIFSEGDMENYIQNKDYDSMYLQLGKWKDKKLNSDEGEVLSRASQILSGEGCLYFYNLGSKYLGNGDYASAISYFRKAYEYGAKSDIYPHITYFLANSIDLSGDLKSASKYYSEYDKNFPQGSYEETVLYRLAVIYKDMDISISKNYARKLIDTYPLSIYNNSVINDIISS